MLAFLRGIIKKDRRRLRRIPCHVNAHFVKIVSEKAYRGSCTITDITREGMCLNKLHFYMHSHEYSLNVNSIVMIYFALMQSDGSHHNFEVPGKIRNLIAKDRHGHSYRCGIKIHKLKRDERKILQECLILLDKQKDTP